MCFVREMFQEKRLAFPGLTADVRSLALSGWATKKEAHGWQPIGFGSFCFVTYLSSNKTSLYIGA